LARIRLIAYPELELEGKITRMGPVLGNGSRARTVWVEFSPPSTLTLRHNMLARVAITLERPQPSLAVPIRAIVRDGLRHFVFVHKENDTFERRHVEVGRSDDRFIEVTRGLHLGELLAINGVSHLQTAYAAVR
jgi:multidrug efflux pump subunit AcrA (membrane-fusion protein)